MAGPKNQSAPPAAPNNDITPELIDQIKQALVGAGMPPEIYKIQVPGAPDLIFRPLRRSHRLAPLSGLPEGQRGADHPGRQ